MNSSFAIGQCRSGKCAATFLLVLLALLTTVANTSASDADPTFYETSREGWFWYHDPSPQEEQPSKPTPTKPESGRTVSLEELTIDDLWTMHPDDFQALLNDAQKQAVQFPSEQKVLEYLTLQDVARRKALAYTHTVSYVTQKYPRLFGMNHVYPTAGPGITARVQMQRGEIENTLREARRDHALLFFTDPRCGYCDKQRQILGYFLEKFGWQVKAIDISRESTLAARFNITSTPTLVLFKRDDPQWMPVATGVIALSELERKLFRTIRSLRGTTSGEDFLRYDFEANSALDPRAILGGDQQPWKANP
jgi:conjugal transfer pilus assembly protein TraF